MTDGILLDTHVGIWLDVGLPLIPGAQVALSEAFNEKKLFLSDISLWEFGTALHKKNLERRPNLQGLTLKKWVERLSERYRIQVLPISSAIAFEAADVPGPYGYGDPGDCFVIAAARIHNLALATHDNRILHLARTNPQYLSVIPC